MPTVKFNELVRKVNLDDVLQLVPASELIDKLIVVNNPYYEFFPKRVIRGITIQYNYDEADTGVAVSQPDLTIEGADAQPKLDTSKVIMQTRVVEDEWIAGFQRSRRELMVEHNLKGETDLRATAMMKVSQQLTKALLTKTMNTVNTYAVKTDVSLDPANPVAGDAITFLKALLKVGDEIYQNDKDQLDQLIIACRNIAIDILLYLNDNKGIIGDNSVSQRLKLGDGSTSALVVRIGDKWHPLKIWKDRYLNDNVLVRFMHKGAGTTYLVGEEQAVVGGDGTQTTLLVPISGLWEDISNKTTKSARNWFVKGELYAQWIPYTNAEDETAKKSRWLWDITFTKPTPPPEQE